jgi:hypothetical protein
MSENTISIYNLATGELVERDMTPAEIAERALLEDADKKRVEANEAVRASAVAKLAALGLTEAEIAAL